MTSMADVQAELDELGRNIDRLLVENVALRTERDALEAALATLQARVSPGRPWEVDGE